MKPRESDLSRCCIVSRGDTLKQFDNWPVGFDCFGCEPRKLERDSGIVWIELRRRLDCSCQESETTAGPFDADRAQRAGTMLALPTEDMFDPCTDTAIESVGLLLLTRQG